MTKELGPAVSCGEGWTRFHWLKFDAESEQALEGEDWHRAWHGSKIEATPQPVPIWQLT